MTNTFCPHTGGLFKPPALPVVMTFDPIKMEFVFKAAVLHEIGGPFKVEDVDLLPSQPGEVRVRLEDCRSLPQ